MNEFKKSVCTPWAAAVNANVQSGADPGISERWAGLFSFLPLLSYPFPSPPFP